VFPSLELLPIGVFFAVYLLSATGLVHRAVAALLGALVLAAVSGIQPVVSAVVPEVLLVTAGLMVLGGFVKRSGLAAWLALRAAKVARGRPMRILVLTGGLSFLLAAAFGPGTAVVLVVPVALVLAVELDVPALPFVVILSWTALLGGATTLTASPGNLWLAASLGIDSGAWLVRVAPFTVTSLVVTLALGAMMFRKSLRVTNERRARVLEYDESRSLENKPRLAKTLVVLALIVAGIVAAPWAALPPSVIVIVGAVLLILWDGPKAVDGALGDIDGATLLFFGALFSVVAALAGSGASGALAQGLPAQPLLVLWGSAVFGVVVDHGAVVGALIPTLKAWTAGTNSLWAYLVLGSTVGAGVSLWGASSSALAFGMVRQGSRARPRREFIGYSVVLALANLVVLSALALFLG